MNASPKRNPRLRAPEVRERLRICENKPEVIDELYDFGAALNRETLDQIKTAETKATLFAGYGTAIAALLVSSSQGRSNLGNECTLWVAFFAGFTALACTYYCAQALLLTNMKVISQDDWFDSESLGDVNELKVFRVFSFWALLNSRIDVQRAKANSILSAQVWLAGSVGYLAALLFQIASLQLYRKFVMGTLNVHQGWKAQFPASGVSLLFSWGFGLLCGLGLVLLHRRSRSVRVILCHVESPSAIVSKPL